MTTHYDVLPDLAFGHHPVYGIVAANPKNLSASTWMLKGFDFHPVPDQPTLYALADQDRDGQGRTARAVALLRKSGYRIDVDAAFNPSPARDAAPVRDRRPLGDPDIAFAAHPRLGIVAAIDDRTSGLTGLALLDQGWRHNPSLDICTLPATTSRDEALRKVAAATSSLHQSGIRVAVHPRLAEDAAACPRPLAVTTAPPDRGQGTPRTSLVTVAALATSPAHTGLPSKVPIPAPVAPATTTRPVGLRR